MTGPFNNPKEAMKNNDPNVNKSANFLDETTRTGNKAAANEKQNKPIMIQPKNPRIRCFLVICFKMGSSSAGENNENCPSSLTTPIDFPADDATDVVSF